MRGQAFVTFMVPSQARRAMQALQNTQIFSKQIKIQMAKSKSVKSLIFEGKFHNISDRVDAIKKSK